MPINQDRYMAMAQTSDDILHKLIALRRAIIDAQAQDDSGK